MATRNFLKPETQAMLNKAVHSELFASNLYKHLSNHMQRMGFFGAQKFFAGESADELTHYQQLADYMNDRGSVADIPMIEAMRDKPTGLIDAIEVAFDTEVELMENYAAWYDECKCSITKQFLLQFLETQRKSVGEYGDLLARLELIGDDKCGLIIIDQELSA
jgi:ferritin